MTDKIEITKEMLERAEDYIPQEEKEAWIGENATKCFDRLAITVGEDPMPPMYMVNTGRRNRYLMAFLVKRYFKRYCETEIKDDHLMTVKEYDRWAGSHVMGQLDRWKHDVAVRDKCYDLLYDFHDLEKQFAAQINGLLAAQNDPVLRQGQYNSAQMKELPKLLEELKAMQEEKKEGADGDSSGTV